MVTLLGSDELADESFLLLTVTSGKMQKSVAISRIRQQRIIIIKCINFASLFDPEILKFLMRNWETLWPIFKYFSVTFWVQDLHYLKSFIYCFVSRNLQKFKIRFLFLLTKVETIILGYVIEDVEYPSCMTCCKMDIGSFVVLKYASKMCYASLIVRTTMWE